MSYLTLVAKVEVGDGEKAALLNAMLCVTKVYNGLMWELRQAYEQTGKSRVSRHNLNRILKGLPRAQGYYSLSVQATRNEVIEAYRSYFVLRRKGNKEARPPGFRRKTHYSGLRYFDGYGLKVEGDCLRLGLGLKREDGVRQVTVRLQHRPGMKFCKVVSVLMTYDEKNGMEAHLVVDVEDGKAKGTRKVRWIWAKPRQSQRSSRTGKACCPAAGKSKRSGVPGRRCAQRSNRQQWKTGANPNVSARSRQGVPPDRGKESRQINHLLHLISKHFVERCYEAGVDTLAIGDLTNIRQKIDYGDHLNQRLHAWPFAKIADRIEYKARLRGIQIIKISEAYSSQTCHACGKIARSNRKTRGSYACSCGWHAHADINSSANLFQSAFHGSPLIRRSGDVASPVVLSLITRRHTVCKAWMPPLESGGGMFTSPCQGKY